MPGRSFVGANGYRYGFNGKENDNEVKGNGNQQDYRMRIYDPRLGKFLSVDPLTSKYPMLTPYQFASNTPIVAIDLDGMEAFIVHGTKQTSSFASYITPEAKKQLLRITGNTKLDGSFNWSAPYPPMQNSLTRKVSAKELVAHIVKTRLEMMKNGDITEDEPISIIGHSHGGNVAIQAAKILGKKGIKVNLVTIGTPAYNTDEKDAYGGGPDSEDPVSNSGINDHIQVVHKDDDVVDVAGGSETFNSGQTKNYVVTDDDIKYDNGLDAHIRLPFSKKLGEFLKKIPEMKKAPAPGIKPVDSNNN
ncbi:MAG: RHS repeat-associated core domain-containing protein [Bacteroidia bacterium]|nr:RHS repeat-associated core domain-containing protein [Bacteroidia bacterium]